MSKKSQEVDLSAEIEAGNSESEFRSAQGQSADAAFTMASFYKRIAKLEDAVMLHFEMFKNPSSIASKLNAAKLAVAKEMGHVPGDTNQTEMELNVPPVTTEVVADKS